MVLSKHTSASESYCKILLIHFRLLFLFNKCSKLWKPSVMFYMVFINKSPLRSIPPYQQYFSCQFSWNTITTSILRLLLKQYNKFKSATIISLHFLKKATYVKAQSREDWKTKSKQRAITHEKVGQPWRKMNLICTLLNFSCGSLLPTFIQVCESIAKNSPEN